MNSKENSTGTSGSAMSRRSFAVGVASIAATCVVGPVAAKPVQSTMTALVEQHRAAKAAYDLIEQQYEVIREATPLPVVRVVTGVDYHTKQPCMWACSETQIDKQVEARQQIPVRGAAAREAHFAWGEKKKIELRKIDAEFERLWSESGLEDLCREYEAIEDIEITAWSALVSAKPSSMTECAVRASYLLSIIGESSRPRLADWLEEFLGSLIDAEVSHAA